MKKLITLLLFCSVPIVNIFAQVTSSAISGRIASSNNEDLIGVVVQAIHVPTGTKYVTISDLNGQFQLPNLTPGGPYKIVVTYLGYKEIIEEGLFLELGASSKADFIMVEDSKALQEVVITAPTDQKTGTSTNIAKEQIQTLPTLSRNLTDFTRLTPQAANNSFGGTSWRYNNVSIDGAINNDAIGFSPSLGGVSGTANMLGSSTRTNSISLDAIDQIQVQLAPYDVKYGNFTGGSINAVTRRGTNELTGSVYAFGRSAAITGPNNSGDKSAMPSSYYDYQIGFRVGLPIIKDKLFFFTNIENTNRQEPLFYGAGSNGALIADSTANHIASVLNNQSGQNMINGGTFAGWNGGNPNLNYGNQDFNIYSKSTKVFARFDWNINEKHQLAYRINYIPSQASYLDRSGLEYRFADNAFVQKNDQISNVLELKSRFTSRFSNQLILGYTTVHDYRDPTALGSSITPQIQISGVNGGNVFIGTDRESAAFNQYSRTFELTDNLNYFWKNHKVTLGTHNEIYGIDYGFVNSYNGRIDYSSLANFYAEKPSRIRSFFNLNDNSQSSVYNNPSAKFSVYMLSAYLQDEWQITDKIKLSPGIRVDLPIIPTGPSLSGLSSDANQNLTPNGSIYNFSSTNNYNNKLLGQPVISPRLGFNIDVLGNQKLIVRGGSGFFMGRIPFAWLGYAYYNNGTSFGAMDYKPATAGVVPIASDPTQFSSTAANPLNGNNALNNALGAGNRREVDLVDPNFKMPYMWRSNLAVDFVLPGNYKLTLEGMYTKTIRDVMLQNLNINQDPAKTYYFSYDVNQQQPIFGGGSLGGSTITNGFNGGQNNYSNIYLLTNTNQGYRYSLTAQLKKSYKFGFDWSAAYTYGQSYDILNGVRNSMESGWQTNQALNPNNPALAVSNFNINNIIVATAGYKRDWNKTHTSYISAILTMQSGTPYSYGMLNTINGTGTQVDLAYIPNMDNTNKCVGINSTTGKPEIIFSDQLDANKNYDPTKYNSPMSQAFYNYVNNDQYLKSREGKFTERNGAQTPWNNRLDLRFMHDVNFYAKSAAATVDASAPLVEGRKHTFQFTLDIINFTNLLNPNWGWYYFVPNTVNSTVDIGLKKSSVVDNNGNNFTGTVNAANGSNITPVYSFTAPSSSYTTDQLASRWQMQIGIRYLF